MLNLELLSNTLNEDTIRTITSFISKEEYFEKIEKITRDIYLPILNSVDYATEFQVGKIYCVMYIEKQTYIWERHTSYYHNYYCFEVCEINDKYITINQLNKEIVKLNDTMVYTKYNIKRRNINIQGDFTFTPKINAYGTNRKKLKICANKCIMFNKLSHLNYLVRSCPLLISALRYKIPIDDFVGLY